jgi:hypothetical protein
MAVEVPKHELGLVEMQEVISKNGGSEEVEKYTCVWENKNHKFFGKNYHACI